MIEKEVFIKMIGRRVAELRYAKKLSQNALGEKCFKDGQSIDKLERGLFNPSAYYLYEIANGLGVSLDDIFSVLKTGDDKKN